ncbi:MAG: O-antigen ligase family protein [Methylomonas sp.]|jgi:O-antigen ligase
MQATRMGLIGRPGNIWLDSYLLLVSVIGILGFLSVRGATNASVFLLLVPALLQLKTAYKQTRLAGGFDLLKPVLLAFALPFLAILISQALRQEWLFKAYDAPARILFSMPLLLYFSYKRVEFSKLVKYCAAPALLILTPIVLMHPEISAQWTDRFATKAVDPTQFGTYTLVLIAFCLFSIEKSVIDKPWFLALQILGLLAGIYLNTGAGTRGSWLVLPILLALWVILEGKRLPPRALWMLIILFITGIAAGLFFIGLAQPKTMARLFNGYNEYSAWMDNTNRGTSTGLRLTLWQMAWELFKHHPFSGYGDGGIANFLQEPWLQAISSPETRNILSLNGAHNELLANLLRSGIFGGIAVLGLFLAPLRLFWSQRNNTHCAQASRFGLVYMVCLISCSVSSEVLTLKYTASFYGLMVAGLTAQVIRSRAA